MVVRIIATRCCEEAKCRTEIVKDETINCWGFSLHVSLKLLQSQLRGWFSFRNYWCCRFFFHRENVGQSRILGNKRGFDRGLIGTPAPTENGDDFLEKMET